MKEKSKEEEIKEKPKEETKEEFNTTMPLSSEFGVNIDIDIDLTVNKISSPKDIKKETNDTSGNPRTKHFCFTFSVWGVIQQH
jgi:hypothetical protein